MSVSIGSTGAGISPGRMMRSFGEVTGGQAFDRRVATRLLVYLRPHWQRMAVSNSRYAGNHPASCASGAEI